MYLIFELNVKYNTVEVSPGGRNDYMYLRFFSQLSWHKQIWFQNPLKAELRAILKQFFTCSSNSILVHYVSTLKHFFESSSNKIWLNRLKANLVALYLFLSRCFKTLVMYNYV